jgi:hypothetical protein
MLAVSISGTPSRAVHDKFSEKDVCQGVRDPQTTRVASLSGKLPPIETTAAADFNHDPHIELQQ